MTVGELYKFLDSLFPVNTACDFDNVGLLIGEPDKEVSRVLISLDCTEQVYKRAVENGCQLIITHHPVIFSPVKRLIAEDLPYKLIKSGISVISMHTNLDIAENGVSDCLSRLLELENTEPYIASDGFTLRKGTFSEGMTADKLAERIKQRLGGFVRYVDGGKKIKNVLVCSGSGGEFAEDAVNAGFDALITAEVKHHQLLNAAACGLSLFDAGHFNTESIVVEPLKRLLLEKFGGITFIADTSTVIKYK